MHHKIILIVEDENTIRDMLQFILTPAGFHVLTASTVAEAETHLRTTLPDLVLVDWMLPDRNGIALTNQLKHDPRYQQVPIILLTAKAEEENKVKGLETGADDYITKPFSPRELIARIQTVLRRGPIIAPRNLLQVGPLQLNLETHALSVNEQTIVLSTLEYKLLYFFMSHPERIYSRAQLLDYVWGKDHMIEERTVDVQIRRLRNTLKPTGQQACIKTIRGSGYQFIP